jgi:hypothetical protein
MIQVDFGSKLWWIFKKINKFPHFTKRSLIFPPKLNPSPWKGIVYKHANRNLEQTYFPNIYPTSKPRRRHRKTYFQCIMWLYIRVGKSLQDIASNMNKNKRKNLWKWRKSSGYSWWLLTTSSSKKQNAFVILFYGVVSKLGPTWTPTWGG